MSKIANTKEDFENKEKNDASGGIECLSLEVLQIVKEAQQQHGLRHADYQRYRQYCSRRIRRIRKVVHFLQGSKHKVQPKKVTVDHVKDHRYLFLPLIDSERSWAYAMQLKSEANTEPRKKFHMISRLKKAVEHADDLEFLVTNNKISCDARTKLEVNAYCSWMRGLLDFECQNWKSALDNFSTSKVICEKLAEAVSSDAKELYLQRCAELSPNIRYCEYNIGDVSAIDDLMQMRLKIGLEDPLTSKLDELIEKTREKQSGSLSEVTWLGRTVPVKNVNVRKLFLNFQQNSKQLADADDDQKLSMCESFLKEVIEAQQSMKDDLKDDVAFKSAVMRGQAVEGPVSGSVYLYSYLTYLKQMTTVDRNLLIVKSIKKLKPEDNKKARPQDFARLYDTIIQNLSEILLLPGLEDKKTVTDIGIQITGYKALRCFYIAQMYVVLKKWKEAMALYERSLKYAHESMEQYDKISDDKLKITKAEDDLKELIQNIEGLKYFAHASSIIDNQEVGASRTRVNLNKPLDKRFHEYAELSSGNLKSLNLMTLPPAFEPIPAKPFFFDLALCLIQFPMLEDRLEQKKSQGGLTGYFKKLIWGGDAGEKK